MLDSSSRDLPRAGHPAIIRSLGGTRFIGRKARVADLRVGLREREAESPWVLMRGKKASWHYYRLL
jgi:hypothetical protein